MTRLMAFATGLAALVGMGPAMAADYPTKPVTMVLGFAPGGPSDVMARLMARKLEQVLGQPVIIDNRPGAGGSIAGQAVARAEPDGYTIMLATSTVLASNVSFYKNLPYDPVKDFEPITLLGSQANVLYVHPSVEAKSLDELIKFAKANPGKLNFGSGGNGTPAHLAGELLKLEAKIDITHVPYKGTGPVLKDVLANHIQMAFSPTAPLLAHVQAGSIRPLAVTTLKRTPLLPDTPAIAESFSGFEATTWHGLVAPAGTPKEIISTLHRAMVETLNDPAVNKGLTMTMGVDIVGNTPEEFAAYIKSEIPKWAKVVKDSGAKLE